MQNRTKSNVEGGFTLIEVMVALAIGIILSTILSLIFVANGSYRNDLDRSSRLVENGSYALQRIGSDAMMAQFYAELDVVGNMGKTIPPLAVYPGFATSKPDPCDTTLVGLRLGLRFAIQGYSAANATTAPDLSTTTCAALLTNLKPGSDILVVRHTEPCNAGPTPDAGCDAVVPGRPYFQATHCADEAPTSGTPLTNPTCTSTATAATNSWCALDTDTANLTLHNIGIDCHTAGTTASYHRYFVDIYYVSTEDKAGDGIPTLKLAQLDAAGGATVFNVSPLAEGVEALRFEYGIDNVAGVVDGIPDAYTADPDTYVNAAGCPGTPTACPANWGNVTTVKVHLLARNTEATTLGYTNDKTFTLGGTTYGPFGDKFKRHVYETVVRLHNVGDRRQS